MSTGPSYWFAFRGNELLVRVEEEGAARLPDREEWTALGLPAGQAHRVGDLDGLPAFAVELEAPAEVPAGMELRGLRPLWGVLGEAAWKLAGRAVQIVAWDRDHRFCGRCGSATVLSESPGELSRNCPVCGLHHFPRVSPAVITLISDGGRMLLARSPHFAPGVYSTIAGFVEPGESLEETVVREIREEVGVEVRNVRYFGSQPWPFPHSLMIGFTAEYAGGEIRIDGVEIEDARWFTPEDLPRLPAPLSIARRLVDDFLGSRAAGLSREDPWQKG
ncbi:MAG TPA: NAD(+) diphosphatase [Thermoanaerobaculia bacterium]|jgi:NAD+ diphosphatase|nr:NAD(+) diphosphatase [Thermoanaerobaculia bacterium]